MPSFKCSKCTRLGRKCTNMLFATLNNTITNYNYKIEEAIEEMLVIIAKYIRNKKIKSQAEERNRTRMLYIQHNLAINDVKVNNKGNCPIADALVSLLPTVQNAIAFINNAIDFLQRNGTIIEPSSSS